MKNILIFLLFFLILSCGANKETNKSAVSKECPKVFFAAKHRNYLESNKKLITLDNLSFKAEINNFEFNKLCLEKNNSYLFPLDLLFIVNPIKADIEVIDLPIYIALLDSKNQLIEMQYFSVKGKFNYNTSGENFIETELIKSLNILTDKNKEISTLLIGFMLDKRKKELIN